MGSGVDVAWFVLIPFGIARNRRIWRSSSYPTGYFTCAVAAPTQDTLSAGHDL